MTKGVWKTLALIALTVAAVQACGTIWIVWAFSDNLAQLAAGAPICWNSNSKSFDSIAAAQMIGRLDLVSFLLTLGGLGLSVFAFMGWWLIRREAKDEAREVATKIASKIAQEYYSKQNEGGTLGGDINDQSVHNGPSSETRGIDEVSTKGASEAIGTNDEESE